MPQAIHQASQTPTQRHTTGRREPGEARQVTFPEPWRGAGPGRRGHGGRAMAPHSQPRRPCRPRGGRASLTAQSRSTETSPRTPPPAESREDAELGLRSEGHRSGHGPGGRLEAKPRAAPGGDAGSGGRAKPRAGRVSIGTAPESGEPGPGAPCTSRLLAAPGPLARASGAASRLSPAPALQPPPPAPVSGNSSSPKRSRRAPGPHLRLRDPVPPQLHHGEVALAQRALDVVEPHPDRPALQVPRAIRHDHAGPRC